MARTSIARMEAAPESCSGKLSSHAEHTLSIANSSVVFERWVPPCSVANPGSPMLHFPYVKAGAACLWPASVRDAGQIVGAWMRQILPDAGSTNVNFC